MTLVAQTAPITLINPKAGVRDPQPDHAAGPERWHHVLHGLPERLRCGHAARAYMYAYGNVQAGWPLDMTDIYSSASLPSSFMAHHQDVHGDVRIS